MAVSMGNAAQARRTDGSPVTAARPAVTADERRRQGYTNINRRRHVRVLLLGDPAGDAETGADLGPGVTERTQALYCLGDGGIDLIQDHGRDPPWCA